MGALVSCIRERGKLAKEENNQVQGNFLFGRRVVPIEREGNVVYARTLRRGEEDTGEAIHLKPGDRLVIPAGELVIDSRDIDEYHNPESLGGYRPVANTVWTWYQIATEQLGFFLFFFSLARRTDAAHALWVSAMQARNRAREAQGIPQRQDSFNALAVAEMSIIALGRCIRMVCSLIDKFCPELQVPDSVTKIRQAVREMRNAFEHIDERAEGKVGGRQVHPGALTNLSSAGFRRILYPSIQGSRTESGVGRYRCPPGLPCANHGCDRRTSLAVCQ